VIERLAPAKLNLGLEILRRREDGYHEIETIFVPLALADRLTLAHGAPGSGPKLAIRGRAGDLPADDSNLVVRAARRTCAELGVPCDLDLALEKEIPIAAGLGGGSSDAAATLLGVEALHQRTLPVGARERIARELGADVPFFLDPRPALGRGIGDLLEPLAGVPEMHWVLVAFPFGIATAQAYRDAAAELTLPRSPTKIAALLGPSGLLSSPRNDFEAPAARRHPEIREARRALERAGASATGMSGSGPTVYGRFEHEAAARAAAERITAEQITARAGARTIATSSPGSAPAGSDWGVAKR
jgi:4-diphosphocytidyl-2-C-methyl-D-erythritol kinase